MKMFLFLVVLSCFAAINGQLLPEEAHPAPEPYAFAFSSPNEDGTSSSREETGDANGRITGSYTILGADGQQRRVEYVADENGFRANVITNEIGTESQNSADAQYLSSAPTAAELVAQWEASGAGRARLPTGPLLRGGAGIVGPAIGGPILAQQIPRPALVGPAVSRPVIRGPVGVVRGSGLVTSPIGPIGSGIVGAQGLRVGQGIRVRGPAIAPLPVPITGQVRVASPIVAPIAAPLPIPSGPVVAGIGGLRAGGITRAQAIGPLGGGLGFIGAGVGPIGVSPIGANQLGLGQFNVGLTPFGGQGIGAGIQRLQTLRPFGGQYGGLQNLQGLGLAYGNVPFGNGGNILVVPGNGLQNPYLSGLSDTQQRLITTDSNESYAKKSK